jgi:hypothetical protein
LAGLASVYFRFIPPITYIILKPQKRKKEMSKQTQDVLWLHKNDNVVVALRPLDKGDVFLIDDIRVEVNENIKTGHKVAIKAISKQEMVIKYGEEIGEAMLDINIGDHVHVHNVRDITAEVYKKKKEELGI